MGCACAGLSIAWRGVNPIQFSKGEINDYLEKIKSISWKLAKILQILPLEQFLEKFDNLVFQTWNHFYYAISQILNFNPLLISPFPIFGVEQESA